MKVVALSDLHGVLPVLPACDLLLICGDICPEPYFPEITAAVGHAQWLNAKLRFWLESLSAKKIVAIAGNHDVLFEGRRMLDSLELPWTYLQDEAYEYKGLKIYGTPWTPAIPNWKYEWTFGATEEELQEKFSHIPSDTDILLTHCPPNGVMDMTPMGPAGSTSLLARLSELNLKLHVFGHIHEGFGARRRSENSISANVSHVDEMGMPREIGWLELEL